MLFYGVYDVISEEYGGKVSPCSLGIRKIYIDEFSGDGTLCRDIFNQKTKKIIGFLSDDWNGGYRLTKTIADAKDLLHKQIDNITELDFI